MPCPKCRIGPNGDLLQLPIQDPQPGEVFPESILRVNISVGQTEDKDTLQINRCQFYPAGASCSSSIIVGDQYVKSACGTWEYKASPETAFSLVRQHTNDNVLGRGIAVNVLRVSIGRVATKLIHPEPEPEIRVRMLIFPNGQLLIATDLEYVPTSPTSTCAQLPQQPIQTNGTTNSTGISVVPPPSGVPGANGGVELASSLGLWMCAAIAVTVYMM